VTAPATVVARPRRLTRVCWGVAAFVVIAFSVVAVALGNAPPGEVQFRVADQVAFVGLGVVTAGAVLLFTRSQVTADVDGIAVRNPLSSKQVPWEVVRGVRLDDGAPWAVLDLHDDETVQLLAVQGHDGDAAVDAVLGLRALLQANRERHAGQGP
jgi:hypothetical protein